MHARRARAAALVMAILVALVVPATALAEGAGGDAHGWDRAAERITEFERLVADGRAAIDAAAIGVGALGFQLAFDDAESIVDVVRERLVFEPYRGVLRGADGALRAGAGNAFDQALVAAVLLTDAGYDVEIPITELDDVDADALLAGVGDARATRDDVSDGVERFLFELAGLTSDAEAARGRLAALLEAGTRHDDAAVALTERLSEALLAALGSDVFDHVDEEARARLVDDVRRYAWVRYRLHEGEAWTDAHPAWRHGDPPSDLEVHDVIDGIVPDDELHRVRIEVFVERRLGDELQVSSVMDPWEMPSALFDDRALTLQLAPLDGAALSAAFETPTHDVYLAYAFDPQVIEAAFFTVAIDGAPAAGAVAFDAAGNVLPLVAALDPAAGVVRSTGRGVATAAGALGALGRSEPGTAEDVLALTGVWFDVTRIEPGGGRHTERRYVVDRLGPEQRAARRIDPLRPLEHHALLTTITVSVHGGAASEMALFDRALARLEGTQPVLRSYLDALVSGDPGDLDLLAARFEEADDAASSAALDHASLAHAMARAPLPPGAIAYRSAPAVVVMERGFTWVDGVEGSVAFLAVDIQADPQRVLHLDSEGRVRPSALDTLRVGVWSTVTERAYVTEAAGAASFASTASAVDDLLGDDVRVAVLRAPSDVAMLPEHVADDDRAAIVRDLERGFSIVVPTAPGEVFTWWRVDVESGATLGLGRGGRGMAERAVVQATSTRIAKYAAMTAWYVQCVAIGTVARTIAGVDTVPVRSCALPLIGVAAGGVTATSAAVYMAVMVASFIADIFGFGDVAL